jgi:WhiB family redox-sensing transcriptional regulator
VSRWQEQALCAEVDPEIFFPDFGRVPKEPLELCKKCDVQPECLELALKFEAGTSRTVRHGVWGGTNPRQRVKLEKGVPS